jgi:sterol desaturase/sphingolipid hydroxylase (fatty acid hydroxylase superfamily)
MRCNCSRAAGAWQVHHSSEDYNQTTALRQSVLQTYTSFFFYLPAALFLPPPMFVAHKHFNVRVAERWPGHVHYAYLRATVLAGQTLYQYWIHTELVGKLGPIEWVFNTPSHHRVHHGRNPYCIDHNYGAAHAPTRRCTEARACTPTHTHARIPTYLPTRAHAPAPACGQEL